MSNANDAGPNRPPRGEPPRCPPCSLYYYPADCSQAAQKFLSLKRTAAVSPDQPQRLDILRLPDGSWAQCTIKVRGNLNPNLVLQIRTTMMQLHAFWTGIQRRCWRDTSFQRKDAELQGRRERFHRFALLPASLRLCAFALNLRSNNRYLPQVSFCHFPSKSVSIRVYPWLIPYLVAAQSRQVHQCSSVVYALELCHWGFLGHWRLVIGPAKEGCKFIPGNP